MFYYWMKEKKSNKNAVSDTLRESSKQRLHNALKQAIQRFGNTKYSPNSELIYLLFLLLFWFVTVRYNYPEGFSLFKVLYAGFKLMNRQFFLKTNVTRSLGKLGNHSTIHKWQVL